MPNIDKTTTSPIENYLLTLAHSLQHVQQQLNSAKVLADDGMSYTSYQLPKLEFELKMAIELEETTEEGQQKSLLKAVPVNITSTTKKNQSTTEASTIKGMFVAVPGNLGKPPAVIRTSLREITNSEYEITVLVQSAVGEYLQGVEVQVNIDPDLSARLSNKPNLKLSKKTYIKEGIIYTNENGVASTSLFLDPGDTVNILSIFSPKKGIQIPGTGDLGNTIAVLVDAMGKTETIIFGA